jgi:hypothetical protein
MYFSCLPLIQNDPATSISRTWLTFDEIRTSYPLINLRTSIPSRAELYIAFNVLGIRYKHLNKGSGQCKNLNLYSMNQKNNFLNCMTLNNYINNILNIGN